LFLIVARVINFCWSCFKWVLVLGAIGGVVAASYLYHRMNEEIRSTVEAKLAQHYAGLKVSVRSADLVDGEGIEVRGISIVEPGADGPAELIYLDEVLLHCSTDWRELLAGTQQVSEITIRRATLRATRRPDGSYPTAKLLPVPKFSERPPKVSVENGTIEIFDPQKSPSGTFTLRDVNLSLIPADDCAAPQPASDTRTLQGTLTGDHLRQVAFEGTVDLRANSWSLGGSIEGLEISPDLREALPGPLAAKLTSLGNLRGQAAVGFRVAYDPSAESPCRCSVSGRLVRGRLDDPRLPHPLTDILAAFRLSNDRLDIDEMTARSSRAAVQLSYHQEGFLPSSRRTLEGRIRQLELDRQLLDTLPDILQQQWHTYRPSGLVDADVKLVFDGRAWHPDISARCLNVSFLHQKFPYRLDRGKGVLELKDDFLQVHMTAYSGSRPVRLDAEVQHVTSGPVGWFEVKGDALQLDEKLLAALPDKPQAVVRSLQPAGTINFYARLSRQSPQSPLRKHLLIGLNRCSIRYEKFPYPLGNIRGTLEMLDDRWSFYDLEGGNDTGRVQCKGYLVPDSGGKELLLQFSASDVPLEEELRNALNPGSQQIWNELKPRGTIKLVAEIRYLSGPAKLSVGVRAEPQGDTASIEPVHFPYRMEKLRGAVLYRDGEVTLEKFRAEHGPVKIAGNGRCDLLPTGAWRVHFDTLTIDRLHLDRELAQSMPDRLRKTVGQLNLSGPINLRGSFGITGDARTGGAIRSQWNLNVGIQRGILDAGVKLENIYGSVLLAGAFDGRNFHTRGELDIDSLTYKDCQLTELRGPVQIDDRRVLLGSWVDRRETPGVVRNGSPRQGPRPLTAKLFGGTVRGDGWVVLGGSPQYALHAVLTRADLTRCAREMIAGRQNLSGTIMATVDLRGNAFSSNAMIGRGNIRLRDADVYELPLMIAMLKILSIHAPDPNAFSTADIDFRIQGKHFYFDRIDFKGDAISLFGNGEMDFQQAIRLTFRAIVGRGDLELPLLKELFHGASEQMMLIHVGGTLQQPRTRKEAFPGVNQAIQQLTDDLQMAPSQPARFPEARQWMPNVGKGWRFWK